MKYWSAIQKNWEDLKRRTYPDSEDMKVDAYDLHAVLSPFRQCLYPIDEKYGGGMFAVVGQLLIGKYGGRPGSYFLCMEKDEINRTMSFFWVVSPGGRAHPNGGRLVGDEETLAPNAFLNEFFPGLGDDPSAMPLRRWVAKYNTQRSNGL